MYDSNVLPSPCMRAGAQRTCVRAFKERLEGGETSRRKRRGVLTMCMCVCLKRNIFLYYYSHRAYFSYPPTCIPGGWVCSFSPCPSFSSCILSLSFILFALSASSPLLGPTGKIQPRTQVVPFLRAHRHEKLRGAPSSAQEPRKRSASIKYSPSLSPSRVSLLSLFLSMIERRLLLQH